MSHTAHTNPEDLVEHFDPPEVIAEKLDRLADWVREANHLVMFTGAGVSTSAGIPDFRGPDGVWTLAAQGRARTKPTTSVLTAHPTPTHMSLVKLQREGVLKYLISQNTDGIHRRSGMDPNKMSELHGNGNMEECEECERRFFRDFRCHRLQRGKDHYTGRSCPVCGGRLLEWTIDFGQNLPTDQLERAVVQSRMADLHIALGSSLTVRPACSLPEATRKKGGRLVIVNLQNTPLDHICDLRFYARTDTVMQGLMDRLQLPIPQWTLRRRVVVEHLSDQGMVCVRGVDPFQHDLPATVCSRVEHGGAARQDEPFRFPVTSQTVTLHWNGHYHEPPCTIPLTGQSYAVTLDFDGKEWTMVDPPRVVPMQCRVVGSSTAGCWGPAVQLGEGFAVLGGSKTGVLAYSRLPDGRVVEGQGEDLPFLPRWGHSCSPVGDGAHVVFGGWDSKYQYNDVYLLTPTDVTKVETSGRVPGPRSCHGAAVLDGKLWVFGGSLCNGGDYVWYNDLYSLNLSSWVWEQHTVAGQPTPRSQCAVVGVDGMLYVLGGTADGEVLQEMHRYDPVNKSWVELSPVPCIPRVLRMQRVKFRVNPASVAATSLGKHIVACMQGVAVFDTESQQWVAFDPSVPKRLAHSMVSCDDGTCYVLGGVTAPGQSAPEILSISLAHQP